MLMRLGNLSDWVKRAVNKEQRTLTINPDKAYCVQEFQDEHGGQRYVVAVIIQAVIEGVDDEETL